MRNSLHFCKPAGLNLKEVFNRLRSVFHGLEWLPGLLFTFTSFAQTQDACYGAAGALCKLPPILRGRKALPLFVALQTWDLLIKSRNKWPSVFRTLQMALLFFLTAANGRYCFGKQPCFPSVTLTVWFKQRCSRSEKAAEMKGWKEGDGSMASVLSR